jgi:methyl-accepting chemotaxis protein
MLPDLISYENVMLSFCCSWITMLFLMLGGPEALAQGTADRSSLSQSRTPTIEHFLQELLTLLKRGQGPSSSLTSSSSSSTAAAHVNGEELRRLSGQISELNAAVQRISESLSRQAEEQVAQRVMIRDVLQMASRIQQQTQQTTTTTTNVTEQVNQNQPVTESKLSTHKLQQKFPSFRTSFL